MGAGVSLFEKIFGLAGKAGAAAADGAVEGVKVLQESLRFWETVAESETDETEHVEGTAETTSLPG